MGGTHRLLSAGAVIALAGCTMIGAPESRPGPTDRLPATTSSTSTASPTVSTPRAAARPVAEAPSRRGNMVEYEQSGGRYRVLDSSAGYDERGIASWYGRQFHGRPTSSGEPFDMNVVSAAHRTLPLPSWVEVTNLANGRSLLVRVNDRGPFHDPDRRIIDLSYAAAVQLGIDRSGTAPVRVRAVEPYQTRVSESRPTGR